MTPSPIRIGIIGTGRHGSRYAHHLRHDVAGCEVTAISRRSREEGQAQAAQWEASYHADWRDLVADSHVDAVIAVTTPNLNGAIATACIANRKPLLLEKPLAPTNALAARIVADFHRADLPLTVGQTLRFNQVIQRLRQELPTIGDLSFFAVNQRMEKTIHPWLDAPELAGGGVVLHTAVHIFDALRYITGLEVTRVAAQARCLYTRHLEDQFSALVEMTNGVQGVVDTSKVGSARTGRYEFVGTGGQLHGDQVLHFMNLVKGTTISPLPLDNQTAAIVPLLVAWRDFLLGSGPNPVTGAEGLAAVKICEACQQSLHLGQWVAI